MLKILTKRSILKVRVRLGERRECEPKTETLWINAWAKSTSVRDKDEYRFIDFLSDFIWETIFRYCAGKDGYGNWVEFASQFGLSESDYFVMINIMKECGWQPGMEKW
jgi:hypothetical protein